MHTRIINRDRIYRWFKFFRLGFSTYVSLPITIISLIMSLQVYVAIVYPKFHLTIEIIILLGITVAIISTISGWVHIVRSRMFQIETIVDYKRSPMALKNMRVLYDMVLLLMEKEGVELSEKDRKYLEKFKQWDEESGWNP